MRYKLFILIFILNFIQSCDSKEKKQTTVESLFKKLNTTRDSLKLIKKKELYNLKLIKKKESDSINKIEEKVALGNINFGIRRKEYLIKEKEFKKITGRRLGDFKFSMNEGYDENGGLSYIILYDVLGVNYDYYRRDMLKQFRSLKEILFDKYGEPIVQNEFPDWTDFERNDKKNIFYWKIGNKSIWVDIENTYSTKYELSITFGYSSPERLNKLRNEKERKEKELKNNAIKNL
jgi:hypothetical protein